MVSLRATLRFFRVVRPVPRLTRLTFVLVTMMSGVAVVVSGEQRRALLPVMVLQLFAASTGFLTYARRGHFDVLLTGGASRLQIALTYWALSIRPGLCGWLALAVIDLAWNGRGTLFSTGTVAAVGVVSMLPWATTVGLTRFAGAIGWLLIVVLVAALTPIADEGRSLWTIQAGEPAWLGGLAFLLFPARMVGEDVSAHYETVMPVLTLALVAMAGAVAWVGHADVPLETGQ